MQTVWHEYQTKVVEDKITEFNSSSSLNGKWFFVSEIYGSKAELV